MAKKKRRSVVVRPVKVSPAQVPRPVKVSPAQVPVSLSKEQWMMQQMFGHGGHAILGEGDSLPKLNGTLISGGGLIKNGDIYGETAAMFGRRR